MKAPPRPTGLKPYYRDDFVTIYHGDCAQIIPKLGKFDLLLTDPPYGINMQDGFGFKGGKINSESSLKKRQEI